MHGGIYPAWIAVPSRITRLPPELQRWRRWWYLASSLLVLAAVVLFQLAQPLPKEAVVRRVVDGDTIELQDRRLVRYIGVDAPEVRRREGYRWVFDPEPFGVTAMEENRRLVEGKRVTLAYDVEHRDRYGRLLAYVSVEGRMVNEQLVAEGHARPLRIPPNLRYAERFQSLAQAAKRGKRGIWKDDYADRDGESVRRNR